MASEIQGEGASEAGSVTFWDHQVEFRALGGFRYRCYMEDGVEHHELCVRMAPRLENIEVRFVGPDGA